jgi:signal transduction histidine kinase
MGQCIILADMSTEQSTLHHMLRTSALIGAAVWIAFLGVSLLLARWMVKPVEEAWKRQKQFVADASHELKTPLTVIMTDAELLQAEDCPEQDRQQLSGNIVSMSVQMRGLVENLLKLARIDNGTIKEEVGEVSFSEVVLNAAMMFEPIFFEKNMPFQYEVEPDLYVHGVRAHLQQVADIFLDNAQKYASPGGQTILRLQTTQHKRCLLEVANQGEEIPEAELANLFKRFYRGDKARTMNHSYGLGLSIASSVADEHHGRVWAKSEDGMNRFYFELPLQIHK